MTFGADAEEVFYEQPVQFRYEGNIFSGEKRAELLVVPALSVNVSPEVAIVPWRVSPPPPPPPAGTPDRARARRSACGRTRRAPGRRRTRSRARCTAATGARAGHARG